MAIKFAISLVLVGKDLVGKVLVGESYIHLSDGHDVRGT